jgi:hypothetical protein
MNNLIAAFNIRKQMETLFQNILSNNSCEELDINNKNISLGTSPIRYTRTDFDYHRFEMSILDEDGNRIGYFSLEVTDKNEFIEEYFVITR